MPTGDLAIDYGTSNTVALVRGSDGRTRQLLFDGSPLLPSAVLAAPDGGLRAGRDAVRAARLDPGRYEPNPKRRIDESEVLLGEQVYPVGSLIAATLAMVRAEARRVNGDVPARVLLTHPVAWGATRRAVLSDACVRAGLPAPTLIPEPVAAATYFAALPYVRIGAGQAVVVYDLGAGTFDVSVVRKGRNGFETLGYNGLDDVGGLDLDALVVQHALAPLASANQAVWQRLTRPRATDDRRHHRMLWDDARDAKETLSRQQSATFPVPLTDTDAMITRAEFERGAQPLLLRTVEVTTEAIRQSRVPADQLAGVFLVGGGSRIPLVATLLHQRQGVAPTALEQPEIVVAEGALAAAYGGAVRQPDGTPVSGPPMGGGPVSGPPFGGAPVSGPPVGVGAGPTNPTPSGDGGPGLVWPAMTPPTPPLSGPRSQPPTPPLSGPRNAPPAPPLSGPSNPPPVPPLSGPRGQSPTPPLSGPPHRPSAPEDPFGPPRRSSGSDDPFGPPPAFNLPQQSSSVWPEAPFDQPEPHRPPGRSGTQYGSSRPTNGGPSWPASGSDPAAQGVSQSRSGSGGRPAPAASGRAYGRPARARQVFAATDPLWLVPTLLWLAVAFGVDWDPARATLYAISSLTLGVVGYPVDLRLGRRLPWWGKLAVPTVAGAAMGVGLETTGEPLVFAVLALVAGIGVAWLVMRRR